MNRYTDTNVWNDGRSYAPDQLAIVEHYERVAWQARWSGRFGFANRAGRASPRAVFHRLVHSATIAIAENFIPAALGLIAGMMLTVGMAYCVSFFL